jgi:hypothetical protein
LYHLIPTGISKALTVGTAVHKALEILLDPKRTTPAAERLVQAEQAIEAFFEKKLEEPAASMGKVAEHLEHGRAQAHACVRAWVFNSLQNIPFTVLTTESVIRAPAPANTYDTLVTRAAAKIDGTVRDAEGRKWLLEHKTLSSIRNIEWVSMLDTDHQAIWYLNLESHTNLEPPVGFYYNAIAKPAHKSGVTWEDLVNRMVEAMCAEPERYFALIPVLVSVPMLERLECNWRHVLERMDNLTGHNIEMNFNACDEYDGCPYRLLCRNLADAGKPEDIFNLPEIELYQIQEPHNELTE